MKIKMKQLFLVLVIMTLLCSLSHMTANAAKASIKLNKTSLTIYVGETAKLKATVTGKNKNVVWTSSKTNIASVSTNGSITAKKAGKTTVKAKANGKTATCVVTVKKEPEYAKAYKKFLSRKTIGWDNDMFDSVPLSKCKFALAYIDNDSIPEMIVYAGREVAHYCGYGKLYTYKKGKVTLIEGLHLNKDFYYYKKKGVYVDTYAGMGDNSETYSKLKKGNREFKLKKNAYDQYGNGNIKMQYKDMSNNKSITKDVFDKKLKNLVGSKKKTKLKLIVNTKKNREKYIK